MRYPLSTKSRNSRGSLLLLLLTALICVPAQTIRIIHGPYLQSVGPTEATVVWITDSVSTGWLEVAPDDGSTFYARQRPRFFDSRLGIKTTGRIHSVRLTGLAPGTAYRYRACSQQVLSHRGNHVTYGDQTGLDTWAYEPYRFTTLDEKKPTASFLVVNDIHGRNNVLETLLKNGDAGKRDMVFFNGDMASYFVSEKQLFGDFFDTAVKTFASNVPLYYVRGNHETRGEAASTFHDYVCPRKENIYYAFRQGPVFFICLDTGEDKPDSDLEYYGITDYDTYRSEEAEWLKGVVASDAYRSAPLHVVVAHIPPYDDTGNWHGNNEVLEKFVPVLNDAGVDLMICGHTHRFGYREADSQCRFPLLTNSNNSVVVGEVHDNQIDISILEQDGRQSYHHTFGSR